MTTLRDALRATELRLQELRCPDQGVGVHLHAAPAGELVGDGVLDALDVVDERVPEQVGVRSLVLMCVKSYDTAAACRSGCQDHGMRYKRGRLGAIGEDSEGFSERHSQARHGNVERASQAPRPNP